MGLLLLVLAKLPSSSQQHEDCIKETQKDLTNEDVHVNSSSGYGAAEWHKACQFSMTSSQASFENKTALIIYQSNEDCCDVNKYLLEGKYYECKYNVTQ